MLTYNISLHTNNLDECAMIQYLQQANLNGWLKINEEGLTLESDFEYPRESGDFHNNWNDSC